MWYQYYNDQSKEEKRLSAFGKLTWRIIDGLKADVQMSTYNHHYRSDSFEKANEFKAVIGEPKNTVHITGDLSAETYIGEATCVNEFVKLIHDNYTLKEWMAIVDASLYCINNKWYRISYTTDDNKASRLFLVIT